MIIKLLTETSFYMHGFWFLDVANYIRIYDEVEMSTLCYKLIEYMENRKNYVFVTLFYYNL